MTEAELPVSVVENASTVDDAKAVVSVNAADGAKAAEDNKVAQSDNAAELAKESDGAAEDTICDNGTLPVACDGSESRCVPAAMAA